MDGRDLRELLEQVHRGELTPDQALAEARRQPPFEDAGGFARVDLQRRSRCGVAEVIFGLGKTAEQMEAIVRTLRKHGEGVLATRVSAEVGALLCREFPEGEYHAVARTFRIRGPKPAKALGKVVVVTAGTSDLPVAEEARIAAENWGCDVSLIVDVGVAGIHRLLDRLADLQTADVLVVVAGMEGALPSVVGGLTSCPVIAVPTSIGYGAHFQGLAPLLGMLNSCASNVVVVNIDAGFSGGHVAGLIAQRMGRARLAATTATPPSPDTPGPN